jgi:hypothetical protein
MLVFSCQQLSALEMDLVVSVRVHLFAGEYYYWIDCCGFISDACARLNCSAGSIGYHIGFCIHIYPVIYNAACSSSAIARHIPLKIHYREFCCLQCTLAPRTRLLHGHLNLLDSRSSSYR